MVPRTPPAKTGDERTAQGEQAKKYLAELRGMGWEDAGMILNHVFYLPDGHYVFQWLELSNVRHLVSFVPLDECFVHVNMWGNATSDSRALQDFSALVLSVHIEGPNQAMQPTAGRRTPKISMIQTSFPAATLALASGG